MAYLMPDSVKVLLPTSKPPATIPRCLKNEYEQILFRSEDQAFLPQKRDFSCSNWNRNVFGILLIFTIFLVSLTLCFWISCSWTRSRIISEFYPCTSGYTWFNVTGFCYKSTVTPMSFKEANNICIADGAQLLSVHSKLENDFVIDLYKRDLESQALESPLWLGLVYNASKKAWNWVDGSQFDFEKWAPGEPNWLNTSKDHWAHIETRKIGGYHDNWDNIGLYNSRAFVCKKSNVYCIKSKS